MGTAVPIGCIIEGLDQCFCQVQQAADELFTARDLNERCSSALRESVLESLTDFIVRYNKPIAIV